MAVLATSVFTGANGSAPTGWTVTANGGSGNIQNNMLRLNSPATAWVTGAYATWTTPAAVTDCDLLYDMTIPVIVQSYPQVALRSPGTITSGTSGSMSTSGYVMVMNIASNTFSVFRKVNGTETRLTPAGADPSAGTYVANAVVHIRFRAIGAFIAVKIWHGAATEPVAWNWSTTDASPYLTAGRVMFASANGGAATARAFNYDNATLTDDGTTTAVTIPGQVTGLTAVGGPGRVTLSWAAVTGAQTYTVYRNGTQIASGVGTTTYTDTTGVIDTSYTYTVAAVNSAGTGTVSAGANAASTTIPPVLSAWQTALANRNTTPAVWYAIGESLQEGQGASTRANRWFDKVVAKLRTAYPSTGSGYFIAARARVYTPDSPWGNGYSSSTGTLTMQDGSNGGTNFGFPDIAHKSVRMNAGATMTFTVTGSALDIHWIQVPDGTPFTYAVDGGAAVTLGNAGTYSPRQQTRVNLGANASHTLVITSTTGSNVFITGVEVFGANATSGIHAIDGGWSSATLATPFLSGFDEYMISVAAIAPDLITIELGGNDSLQSTPLATFKSQAQQLIDGFKALPKVPSIIWVFPSPVAPTVTNAANLVNYQAQIEQIIASDPSIGMVSLYNNMPVPDTSGTGMYRNDGVHPNDSGQTAMGDVVYAGINPPPLTRSGWYALIDGVEVPALLRAT